MLFSESGLGAIKHPLISSLHMRKDFCARRKAEDVLVIETNFSDLDEYKTFDSYLLDLLLDLKELKNRAEHQVGKFDRVDIRLQ